MGKSLIIRDADFSQVSIPVDRDVTPLESDGFNGYWNKEGIFSDDTFKSYIIPTTVGKSYMVTCKASPHTTIVALSTNTTPNKDDAPEGILAHNTGEYLSHWQTITVVATHNYLSFSSSVYSDEGGEIKVIELADE